MLSRFQTAIWLFVAAETTAYHPGHFKNEDDFSGNRPIIQKFQDEHHPSTSQRGFGGFGGTGVHTMTSHPHRHVSNVISSHAKHKTVRRHRIRHDRKVRRWATGSRFEGGVDKQLNGVFDEGATQQPTNTDNFYARVPTVKYVIGHGVSHRNASFPTHHSENHSNFAGTNKRSRNHITTTINDMVIETIQSSSGIVVNQLNKRCDALESKLDMQYRTIGVLANQSGRFHVEQHPREQGSFSDCTSKSNKIVQEILSTIQDLSELLNTFRKDFHKRSNMIAQGSPTNIQNWQTSQDTLISSISDVSQQTFQRFEKFEKQMHDQQKKVLQFLENQRTILDTRSEFESRVDSFMTTMTQTSETITDLLEGLRKNWNVMRQTFITQPNHNPINSVSFIETVEKKLETILRQFIEKRTETSFHTDKTVSDIHKQIELMRKHQMSGSVGPRGLQNHELMVEIRKEFSKMNEHIREPVMHMKNSMSSVQTSMKDILNMLGKGIQPCGSEGLTQSSLESVMTKVIEENSQKLGSMFHSMHADMQKCCANPNSRQENGKNILGATENKMIHGVCGEVSGLLTEIKPLLAVNKGVEMRYAAKAKAQQEEWEAMMAALKAERAKMSVQLEMYKKALDDRQCEVVGKIKKWSQPSAAKNYRVTRKPISSSRSSGIKNGTKVYGKIQKWSPPLSSKKSSAARKPIQFSSRVG